MQPPQPSQPWARQPAPVYNPPQPPPLPPRPMRETPGGKILIALTVLALLAVLYVVFLLVRNLFMPKGASRPAVILSANAFPMYEAAGKKIVRKDDIAAMSDVKSKRIFTIAERAKLVAENAAPLAEFRRGFGKAYRSPPIRSASQLLPYYADFRNAARLMRLESDVKLARGDAAGAASSGMDALQFGRQIGSGSPLIGGLVSIACQAIGGRGVWKSADSLNAPQAKAAARRLEKLLSAGTSYAQILEEERFASQAALLEMFRKPEAMMTDWQKDNPKEAAQDGDDAQLSGVAFRFLFFYYGKQNILNHLNATFDRAIAQAKKSYAADHAPLPQPGDPVTAEFLPVIDGPRLRFVTGDAHNALLLTTLALRAYHQERGDYPPSLAALVPVYLTRLPDDPFARVGPLGYIARSDSYQLYSVGPDGSDDRGKPIDNPGKQEKERRRTFADSKGDIVAGTNVY